MKTKVMPPKSSDNDAPSNPPGIPNEVDKLLFYVRAPLASFSSEGNKRLKEKRIISITPNLFRTWISRYITRDKNPSNPEWFTFSIENDEIVVGFMFESESKAFETMLEEIKENGFPSHFKWKDKII